MLRIVLYLGFFVNLIFMLLGITDKEYMQLCILLSISVAADALIDISHTLSLLTPFNYGEKK